MRKLADIAKHDYSKLALFSLVFNLFFSTSFSPLTEDLGADSLLFFTFGNWMAKDGLIPYKDMFDHKGPMLWFMEGASQLLFKGPFGVFVMLFIITLFCLILVYKTSRLLLDEKYGLTVSIIYLIFFNFTFLRGNLTEELSLPFVMLTVYLFVREYKSDFSNVKWYVGFAYGICFCSVMLIRVNNMGTLCVTLLALGLVLLIRKKIARLFLTVLTFLSGVAAVAFPVALYYIINGAFSEMIFGTFIFNFVCIGSPRQTFLQLLSRNSAFTLPLFIFAAAGITGAIFQILRRREYILSLTVLFSSLVNFWLATLSMRAFPHYVTVALPSAILGIILLAKNCGNVSKTVRIIVFTIFACAAADLTAKAAYSFTLYYSIIDKISDKLGIGSSFTPYVYLSGVLMCGAAALIFMLFVIKRKGEKKSGLIFLAAICTASILLNVAVIPQKRKMRTLFKNDSRAAGKLIPKENMDSVFCYNTLNGFYYYNNIVPSNKYIYFQDLHISYYEEIFKEIVSEFEKKPPKTIVTGKRAENPEDPRLQEFLDNFIAENYIENENNLKETNVYEFHIYNLK